MGYGTGGIHKNGNRSGRKAALCLVVGIPAKYKQKGKEIRLVQCLSFSRLVRSSPSFPLVGESDTRMQLRILLGIFLVGGVLTIS